MPELTTRRLAPLFLLLTCFLPACAERRVEIQVFPSEYQVGRVRSDIATPAVDEVLRLKPAVVVIQACRSVPPIRTIQLQTELSARTQARLQLQLISENCPS